MGWKILIIILLPFLGKLLFAWAAVPGGQLPLLRYLLSAKILNTVAGDVFQQLNAKTILTVSDID